MCFATQSGNTITFELRPRWNGSITIAYAGACKKKALVNWGVTGGSPIGVESCNVGPTETLTHSNSSGAPLSVSIELYYATDDCTGGEPISIAMSNGNETHCSNGTSQQSAVFDFEGLTTGDTAQIIIDNTTDQIDP